MDCGSEYRTAGFAWDLNGDVIPDVDVGRHDNKPIRVVTEMREVLKYPQSEGFVLERVASGFQLRLTGRMVFLQSCGWDNPHAWSLPGMRGLRIHARTLGEGSRN